MSLVGGLPGVLSSLARPGKAVPKVAREVGHEVAAPAADTRVAAAPPAATDRLPPADRDAFQAAWNATDADGRARLSRLLAKGTLSAKDSQGHTLAANLAALARVTPPAGAPYSARDVLGQVLQHLDDPQSLHQDNRNTCAATTVSYVLLTTQPAEYARLATALAGPGQAPLQGGGTLRRVPDSVARDDSSRDDVMRLMQAAFMDQGGHLRGSYSNVKDSYAHQGFLGKLLAPVDKLVASLKANFGIGEHAVANLYQHVLGQQAHTAGDLPMTDFLLPGRLHAGVYDQVAKAVAAGKAVPVDILVQDLHDAPGQQQEHVLDPRKLSYGDQMRSHQVLVTKIADGNVYYRNPWGYETHMTLAEFKSRLTDAVIPA